MRCTRRSINQLLIYFRLMCPYLFVCKRKIFFFKNFAKY
nr:MAG TPA: hypothetical protein [Caudoviricetes sp.]